METKDIAFQLKRFIRDRFHIPEVDPEFTDDVNLFNYGYVDSFGAVDLYAYIEKEFSLRFSESELATAPLNTIRELSSFIASRQKEDL
jgi:D-alanine--poly(phosphoribitol) ligase subunit 2